MLNLGYNAVGSFGCLPEQQIILLSFSFAGKESQQLKKVTGSPLVIVTSPLISLMTTHTYEGKTMGISAVHLPDPGSDVANADILFGSPEYWISSAGCEMLQKVSDRVVTLVVDEVHVAPKWYSIMTLCIM